MNDKEKKIGMQMNIYMGITLSICLSLLGNLTSGHFTPVGFLISAVVSSIISLIIGSVIPIGKVSERPCEKLGLKRGSLGARSLSSLISDCIYTPIITLAMVFLASKMAARMGGTLPFLPAFIKSLILSMIVGFVLVFIFTPFYLRIVMKANGVDGPPAGNGRKDD